MIAHACKSPLLGTFLDPSFPEIFLISSVHVIMNINCIRGGHDICKGYSKRAGTRRNEYLADLASSFQTFDFPIPLVFILTKSSNPNPSFGKIVSKIKLFFWSLTRHKAQDLPKEIRTILALIGQCFW